MVTVTVAVTEPAQAQGGPGWLLAAIMVGEAAGPLLDPMRDTFNVVVDVLRNPPGWAEYMTLL